MKSCDLRISLFLLVSILSIAALLEFATVRLNATANYTVVPEISNTTSAEIPSEANNPTLPTP